MKKILIIISTIIIEIILIIGYCSKLIKESNIEDNLKTNSVYYAKNIPHAKDKHPVFIMLIDNLDYLNKPKVDNIRYDIDGINVILEYKDEKTDIKSFGNIYSYDTEYIYEDEKNLSYRFSKDFKLISILDEHYKYIDISTVDEQAVIDEIYEFVKPIVDSQTEPEVNLQEEFNKRYKDRFN